MSYVSWMVLIYEIAWRVSTVAYCDVPNYETNEILPCQGSQDNM